MHCKDLYLFLWLSTDILKAQEGILSAEITVWLCLKMANTQSKNNQSLHYLGTLKAMESNVEEIFRLVLSAISAHTNEAVVKLIMRELSRQELPDELLTIPKGPEPLTPKYSRRLE